MIMVTTRKPILLLSWIVAILWSAPVSSASKTTTLLRKEDPTSVLHHLLGIKDPTSVLHDEADHYKHHDQTQTETHPIKTRAVDLKSDENSKMPWKEEIHKLYDGEQRFLRYYDFLSMSMDVDMSMSFDNEDENEDECAKDRMNRGKMACRMGRRRPGQRCRRCRRRGGKMECRRRCKMMGKMMGPKM